MTSPRYNRNGRRHEWFPETLRTARAAPCDGTPVSDPTHVYTGWLLDPADREALLAALPARYPLVVAHHVTLKFGDAVAGPPSDTVGEILGEADDGAGVQAMVLAIGGAVTRPDGGTFHITW